MKALKQYQEQWIQEKLKTMSLREKIGQMTCVRIAQYLGGANNDIEDYKKRIDALMTKIPLSNIFIGAEIIHETSEYADRMHEVLQYLQSKVDIPCLVAGDIEYGVGASVKGMTVFPNNMTFAAMEDEQLAYEAGKITGREARAVGFNWCFGPVVDLYANWMGCGNGRMISDDPDLVIRISKALIKGMQDGGMIACAKHFPDPNYDFRNPHITNVVNDCSEEEWYAKVGKIYKALTESELMSVMSAHCSLIFAEDFNEEQNAYCPASMSSKAINGILREKIGFDGVVVTDSAGMGGFKMWKTKKERLVDVFNAGNDMFLFPDMEDFDTIEEAVRSGEIPESRVNESVYRILRMKQQIGLIEQKEDTYGEITEIREEAERINEIMLKNSVACVRNLDHLLPLDKDKVKRILVLKLDKGQKTGVIPDFLNELAGRGIELDVYEVADFADWSKPPQVLQAEKDGRRWDAYLQLYNYSYIGDYRPSGLITQALWRSAGIESVKPILISFRTPYLLHDFPTAKTYITTFSANTNKIAGALVKALFGEEEFMTKIPIKDIG